MKKIVKEWVLPLAVVGLLYITGLHRPIISGLQRGLLYTGLFNTGDEQMLGPEVVSGLRLLDEAGNPLPAQELEGKVTVINFWASWCAPCLAEMPDFEALYQQYKNDLQIQVLMVSVDEEFERALALRDKKEYSFPVYRRVQVPDPLKSNSIPATFVIGPEGKLRYEHRGMARYDTDKFRKLLEQLAAEQE